MTNSIEVEVRSFISENDYKRLKAFFDKEAQLLSSDSHETYYFTGNNDLRIQKNDRFAKIVIKRGKMHDDFREEIEIHFDRDDFDKILRVFNILGFDIKIIWLRKRIEYQWEDIKICLDNTKGYGYIIEFEQLSSSKNARARYSILKEKLESLGITISSRDEFSSKFDFYEKNWKTILNK